MKEKKTEEMKEEKKEKQQEEIKAEDKETKKDGLVEEERKGEETTEKVEASVGDPVVEAEQVENKPQATEPTVSETKGDDVAPYEDTVVANKIDEAQGQAVEQVAQPAPQGPSIAELLEQIKGMQNEITSLRGQVVELKSEAKPVKEDKVLQGLDAITRKYESHNR